MQVIATRSSSGQQGAPDMGAQQPNGGAQPNNGGDPNVYDADFTDVDNNN